MPTGHVFIATSLDGFIAREDHTLDWLPQEEQEGEDTGYDAFMASVDGIVMGRSTYETIVSFNQWPYRKPVIVMTKQLKTVPDELADKVELSSHSPSDLMRGLGDRGWGRIYIDGGKVVQSFLKEGLIQDMIITTIPILIGQGRSLFGPLERDISLELVSSHRFASGMVQSHYRCL